MVEDSTSEETSQKSGNRDEILVGVHRYSEIDTSSVNESARSITDIRNELQNVLDLMGPTTNTSSEADNEESQISILNKENSHTESSTKTKSSKISTKKKSIYTDTKKLKPKIIEENVETLYSNRDSVVADISLLSINNDFDEIEHSCCDHNHIVVKPECLCPNETVPVSRYCERQYPLSKSTRITTIDCKKPGIIKWIKEKSSDLLLKKSFSEGCELYKINIQQMDDGAPPKRVIFDLVEGMPKPTSNTVATNTIHIRNPIEKYTTKSQDSQEKDYDFYGKNLHKSVSNQKPKKIQKNIYYDSDGNSRVDFYYFDHGNAQYFHTTDTPPILKSEILAEKTERYTTRFWAEIFASIHIGVSFCISFFLQFFKFLLYSIIRPLSIGVIQMGSDYFLKPFLTTFFNGIIQPILIFFYNIVTSIRDLSDPIAEAFGYFCREVAVLLKAIRCCTYKRHAKEDGCDCKKKEKCQC